MAQTRRTFTGQHLDETGLLFSNARSYDPVIGRFVSADTIVPGSNALTVWPGDPVAGGAWGGGGGPANPQDFNRYSYALNNPVRFTDPSGHIIPAFLAGALIGTTVNTLGDGSQGQGTWASECAAPHSCCYNRRDWRPR